MRDFRDAAETAIAADTRDTRPAAWSPAAVLDTHAVRRGVIHIVRDDLLPGGTKQRAILPLLERRMARGTDEFVYASPFCGFAQLALAYAARTLGARCRLFVSRPPQGEVHTKGTEVAEAGLDARYGSRAPATAAAAAQGAVVTLCESLHAAEDEAQAYVRSRPTSWKIPLGFRCDAFDEELRRAVSEQWETIRRTLRRPPRSLWLPVGSGTFAHACRSALPNEISLMCVNVRVLDDADPRLTTLSTLPGVRILKTPEVFEEPCLIAPPVPSNRYYDGKLWRFVTREAHDGDLWWNIAGDA